MKDPRIVSRRMTRWIAGGTLAVALSAFAPQSFAQIVTLTHNNSTARINTSGGLSSGMTDWSVDGLDPLQLQWFWYRAGAMTSEARIDAISAPIINMTSARQSTISYFNGSFGVSVDYLLTGGSAGSGFASINEVISITNASATPLTFSFFQYSDFNLGGGPGDHVGIGTGLGGLFNEAVQTNGPNRLAESSITPGANRAEAAIFPFTLTRLDDASVTILNNTTSAGPGDATWAFQWDFVIAAGGSVGISKLKDVTIPEPSMLALMGLGTVACMIYRRQKTRRH